MPGKFEIPAKSSRCKDYEMEDKRYVSGYDQLEHRKSRGDQKRTQQGRTEMGYQRVLKLSPSLK